MPSSGARSGTIPNRPKPAGNGSVGPTKLACGHETHVPPVITGARTLYQCPNGCGFVKEHWR